jgi:hypothetical protein
MTLYAIALFIHVVGAVLVFVLLTAEVIGLTTGSSVAQLGRILGPIASLAIIVPGIYMAFETRWYAWTAVGLATYVVLAAVGAYTGVAFMRGRISTGAATISWAVRAGLAFGVLFDMTVKPDAIVSIAAVLVAAAAAAAASVPLRTRLTTA